jgi:GntP family gluconate:H+ symporter
MHGLMPPHPGPVIAIDALKADMGKVILWALVLGIPVAAIAGPFFARSAVKRVDVATPEFTPSVSEGQTLPTFGFTIFTVLLPVLAPDGHVGRAPARQGAALGKVGLHR